jgi:endonuclease YncB( thermonuclease family)
MITLVRALVLVIAGAFLLAPPLSAGATTDRDCADFATQAAAQSFMLASGPGDPHGLDGNDDDGVACESNPCPCATTSPQPFAGVGSTGPVEVVRRDVGNVVRVTDGDTLRVRVRGAGIQDVRIIGIDTPEVHSGHECGGVAASDRMARLAPVGSRVTLISDPSQDDVDRYDRLLRYVERDGRDVGRAQVNLGYATVYVYANTPFRRTAGYRRVQQDARQDGRGSWGTCW